MPRRYDIISEPEQLEVVDNGVYRPDQCEPDFDQCNGRSRLSLDPIIERPISLKTIFMDARWTLGQRRLCLGVLLAVGIFCLCVLIALFAGLGRVLAAIAQIERKHASGLQFWPNPKDIPDDGLLAYGFKWENRNEQLVKERVEFYTQEIDLVVGKYKADPPTETSPVDCSKLDVQESLTSWCKFPVESILKGNCTKENYYGYFNMTPCMLFALRRPAGWSLQPNDTQQPNVYPSSVNLSCKVASATVVRGANSNILMEQLDYTMWPQNGFDARFLVGEDSVNGVGKVEPLVMIQFNNLHKYPGRVPISCNLHLAPEQNVDDSFSGMTFAEFSFAYVRDGAVSMFT